MARKIIYWLVTGLLLSAPALAQDAHFSQQFANRLHLNPAFAGIRSNYTVTGTYRNQWPLLGGSFITNQLAADLRIKDQKSAFGFTAMYDKAGSIGFSKTEASGIYAYHSKLSEQLAFSGGISAGYGSHRFDADNFLFGDQLTPYGFVAPVSAEQLGSEPARFFNISAGTVIYGDQFWLSLAGYHLNQPDIGFAADAKLPARVVVNAGYKMYVSDYYKNKKLHEFSFTPTITYMQQGGSRKLDLGLYTTYTPLTLGILYRGMQAGSEFGYDQSLAVILGFEFEQFRVGYSYDAGLSGLGSRSGGSHEVTLTFENVDVTKAFKKRAVDKNYRTIACPAF